MSNSEGRKDDFGKLRWDLVPFDAMEEVVRVLTFGAIKYDDNNWKVVENSKARYSAAMFRHLSSYMQGVLKDNESGISHLAHAICCGLFLLWFEMRGK